MKGLKGGRGDNSPKFTDEHQLEALLSTFPFSESLDALDEEEEINIGSLSLSISLSDILSICDWFPNSLFVSFSSYCLRR